jgi:hypothetical protein
VPGRNYRKVALRPALDELIMVMAQNLRFWHPMVDITNPNFAKGLLRHTNAQCAMLEQRPRRISWQRSPR